MAGVVIRLAGGGFVANTILRVVFLPGGSAVDRASVVVDLGNSSASLYPLDNLSGTSGSEDWQASSYGGVVDGVGVSGCHSNTT